MYNTEIDTFLLVAECGSFSQAAKKLYISTAAVSQQIKLLEDQLDVQLFIRSKRGVSLTSAGTEFVAQARRIKAVCQEASQVMRHYRRSLTIGAGYLNGQGLTQHFLPAFRKKYPDIQINFKEINDYNSIPDRVDLLEMAYSKEPVPKQGFRFVACTQAPLKVALPQGHPLAAKELLTWQDLAGQDLAIVDPHVSDNEMLLAQLAAVRPKLRLHYYPIFNRALVNQVQLAGWLLLVPDVYADLCLPYLVVDLIGAATVPYGFFVRQEPGYACQKLLEFIR